MFNKYLAYNKYRVNLNFIYLLRNCLLILICKTLKCKRILLAKRYIDVEDKEIANTIERYIALGFELNID
jgi:hypothetical protein